MVWSMAPISALVVWCLVFDAWWVVPSPPKRERPSPKSMATVRNQSSEITVLTGGNETWTLVR